MNNWVHPDSLRDGKAVVRVAILAENFCQRPDNIARYATASIRTISTTIITSVPRNVPNARIENSTPRP